MISLKAHLRWVVQDRVREPGGAWGAWETVGQRLFTHTPDAPSTEDMRPTIRLRCLRWLRTAPVRRRLVSGKVGELNVDHREEAAAVEYRLFDVSTKRAAPRLPAFLTPQA